MIPYLWSIGMKRSKQWNFKLKPSLQSEPVAAPNNQRNGKRENSQQGNPTKCQNIHVY